MAAKGTVKTKASRPRQTSAKALKVKQAAARSSLATTVPCVRVKHEAGGVTRVVTGRSMSTAAASRDNMSVMHTEVVNEINQLLHQFEPFKAFVVLKLMKNPRSFAMRTKAWVERCLQNLRKGVQAYSMPMAWWAPLAQNRVSPASSSRNSRNPRPAISGFYSGILVRDCGFRMGRRGGGGGRVQGGEAGRREAPCF